MNLLIKEKGFTLVEVLVTMTMIGVLLVMAVPSFKSTKINNSLIAETNQLNSAFALARNEAYRRNNYVSVCASNNGSSCSGNNFATGMIIFNNPDKAGLSNNNQIIKVFDNWSGNDKGKITVDDGSTIFTFNGVPETLSGGSILVCYPGYNSYTLNVNASGSLKMTNNTGDGGC